MRRSQPQLGTRRDQQRPLYRHGLLVNLTAHVAFPLAGGLLAELGVHQLGLEVDEAAFAVLGVVTVVLPWVIFSGRTTFGSLAAAVSALVSGPVAALLGKSATTLFSRSSSIASSTT